MSFFTPNLDKNGKLLRLGIGCVLLGLSMYYNSIILLLVALFTFFEALFSWCVIYALLGKSSCPIDREKK